MTKLNLEALEKVWTRMLRRIFNEQSIIDLSVVTAANGSQNLLITWNAGGWDGRLELRRQGVRVLTSKEIGGLLAFLADDEGHG